MVITPLVVGQLQTNCYIVSDASNKAVIIDPGDDAQFIIARLSDLGLTPTHILATHGHFDHILAAFELQQAYGLPFYIHEKDRFLVERMHETAAFFLKYNVIDPSPKITHTYKNGDIITVGAEQLEVIEAPGHTPGSICLVHQNSKSMFVGDTVFADGGVGRTDFKYSSPTQLQKSLQKIFSYAPSCSLYPGHGQPSTVDKESKYHSQFELTQAETV